MRQGYAALTLCAMGARYGATTAKCLAATAAHMTAEQWQLYSTKQLLSAAGKLVSDNTPEARGAAKGLIGTMQGAFTEVSTVFQT